MSTTGAHNAYSKRAFISPYSDHSISLVCIKLLLGIGLLQYAQNRRRIPITVDAMESNLERSKAQRYGYPHMNSVARDFIGPDDHVYFSSGTDASSTKENSRSQHFALRPVQESYSIKDVLLAM